MNKTIFSGTRPTGKLHIGNYLGAVKQWVGLQKKFPCIFCIVDYHGITTPFEPKQIKKNISEMATDLIALGIPSAKTILFRQSEISEHTELAWILNTITPIAELKRMTQFKEKSKLHQDYVNVGLFDYPVLMAADILLYKAIGVPVGEDQVQHVELTRLIARKFNNMFGQTFPEPKTILSPHPRIMSLVNPSRKMEKSLGEKSYIALSDEPATIKNKIMKAVTDPGTSGKLSPGVENLMFLVSEFSSKNTYTRFQKLHKEGKIKYQELKETLAEDIINYFKEFRAKRKELAKNSEKIDKILDEGAKRVKAIAAATLKEVKEKIGLI